jgi:hypothetical protein
MYTRIWVHQPTFETFRQKKVKMEYKIKKGLSDDAFLSVLLSDGQNQLICRKRKANADIYDILGLKP